MTPEDKDKITDDIMSAFDGMVEEGAEQGNIGEGVEEPSAEPADDEREGEPEAEPEEGEPEESEEVEEVEVRAEGDEGDAEDEEPEPEEEKAGGELDDESEYPPEIQALIDRHDGDIAATLRSAVEMQKMLGRRNQEHGEMHHRLAELEALLAQAQAFDSMGLSPEQSEWVEQAVESDQPTAFVQAAVANGEFDLARAVCDAWGQNGDAYSALRTRQMVDQAEGAARYAQQAGEPPAAIPQEELFGLIQEQVPDFSNYWAEMTEIVNQLGPEHPMVAAAKSADPNEAAAGLIDIYKVARTRSARISEARKQVETQQKEQGVAARKQARVSSSSSRASHGEPPQTTKIAPGLTLEELDAALAAE